MDINIKELFSLINVDQLKQLAMKHNVLTGIKAPSQMLKAELVNALSQHYKNLIGTDIIPVAAKPLKIDRKEIPRKFLYPEKPVEKKRLVTVAKAPWQVRREEREARSLLYGTKEKLKIAEEKSLKRKQKQKAKLQAKKKIETNKAIYKEYEDLLKNVEKLKSLPSGDKKGIEIFQLSVDRNSDLFDTFKNLKEEKVLSKNDIESIQSLQNKIDQILDDDVIIDKFDI